MADEAAVAQLGDGLLQLGLGVHHDRSIPGDRLLDRLARDQQEADALVARGMPFVFATGYGERGLPEPYRDRPTLKKPFQMDGLKQMLQTALDRGKN